MPDESDELEGLFRQGSSDGRAPFGPLVDRYRDKLLRIVRLRLDRRLRGRVSESDVIQDVCAEAWQRLDEYRANPEVPFFVWLRFLTGQKLATLHRRHLGVQARDASREFSIFQGPMPEATSAALAAQLVGRQTSPTEAAVRAELQLRVEHALNAMEPVDREIVALRHFEQLTNAEAAWALGISEAAASKRYLRALRRLRKVLVRPSDSAHTPGNAGAAQP